MFKGSNRGKGGKKLTSVINYDLKERWIILAQDVLRDNFFYSDSQLKQFDYAFHLMFQDYMKEMIEHHGGYTKGLWKNILQEITSDMAKREYFSSMLIGYQIMRTLDVSLEFNEQELQHFEQLFMKKVNFSHDEQTHERKDN